MKRGEVFWATLAPRSGSEQTGRRPVVITVHSFTPVYFGKPRAVEFGIIHDADPALALAIHAGAVAAGGLDARINAPYSAADDVTHTLRLHATPYGLANAMLELRNDLIATPEAEAAMAERLAPLLARAVAQYMPPRTLGVNVGFNF